MKIKRNHFLLPILLIFIGVMTWLVFSQGSDMVQLEGIVDFSQGWTLQEDPDENTVIFEREILPDMLGKVLCFYVYDSFVDANVDGEIIYHFGETYRLLKSPGTLWHMVEIPADSLGEPLSIKIRYAYDYKYTTDTEFVLGSSGAIILSLLGDEALDLFVNIVMLVLGVILCTIYFIQLKNNIRNDSSLFLGLLSLCFVFWTNNNLFFTQLIFPYGAGQYFSYYFFLFMLPLLLICYLETITKGLKFNYLFWCHITLVLVLTILQLTGIAELTETITIFLGCAGVEMVIVLVRLIKGRSGQGNKVLIFAFIILVICILINAVYYFFHQTEGVSTTISKVGISFYLVVSIYDGLIRIITDMAEAQKSKILRKIAYTDSLTGVGNRYAFNDEVNGVPMNELALFSLDINNLKYYNDTFGHACGDTLICDAVGLLGQVFDRLYRTGGDEFIAITTDRSEYELAEMKNKLGQLMVDHNQAGHDIVVEIACGYSAYREGDVSYEDMLRRADSEMYLDKTELKKKSKIASVR